MAAIVIVIVAILIMVAGLSLSAERTEGKKKVVPEDSSGIPRNRKTGDDIEKIISNADVVNLLYNRPPLKPGKLKALQDMIQKVQGGLERFLFKIGLIGFPGGTPVSFVVKINLDPNCETEWYLRKQKTRSGTGIVYQFLVDQYWVADMSTEELVKKYLSLIYETGAIKIKEAEFKSRGFQAIMEFLEKGKKKPQPVPVPKETSAAPEKKEKEKVKQKTESSSSKATKRTKGNSSSQSLSKEDQKKIEAELVEIEKRKKENARIFGEEIAENVYRTERENILRKFNITAQEVSRL